MHVKIYTLTYNEEVLLPVFIKWYRARFSDLEIIVYDNESTDKTLEICEENNVKVITYKTNSILSDLKYLEIKNNCWKDHKGWCIVCDVDELIDISERNLREITGDLVMCVGYDMVNVENHTNLMRIKTGVRNFEYDKIACFNSTNIDEINYFPGAHRINPVGKDIKLSNHRPNLYHMKYIGENFLVKRYGEFKKRLSEENLLNGWGAQYLMSEDEIRKIYWDKVFKAKIVR